MGKKISADFAAVFARLRSILKSHSKTLAVSDDSEARYCVEGGSHPTHKVPMPIAWVQVGKGYVSYHLMPVYCCPKLSEGLSKKLKARMQGKSCFNFKVVDEELFDEVDRLTKESMAAFKESVFFTGSKAN